MKAYPNERFYKEVFLGGEYGELPKGPDLVVLDVGAHIGMFSMWIYPVAKAIYAFEAEQKTYDRLVQTIQENDMDDKVRAYHAAVSDRTGEGILRVDGTDGGHSLLVTPDATAVTQTVATIQLKDFMDKNNISHCDLMKIDIEGGEMAVFNDQNFPADRITKIVGEVHSQSFQAQLEGFGYHFEKGVTHPNTFIATK